MTFAAEIFHREGLKRGGRTVHREAVRAIITSGDKVLMIYSPINGDFKFPGGGVDIGETPEEAIIREVKEESGATVIRIGEEIGRVTEYDVPLEEDFDVFQMTSVYYLVEIEDALGTQNLDLYERDLGFRPVWVTVDEAIRKNRAVLSAGDRTPPRWTARDTYVLERLRESVRIRG